MPISNFNYHNSTRILFGRDTIKELEQYLPKDKHFIICYGGGSIKKNGVYDELIKALSNRKYEEFSGIEANPDYETLMKCVNRIKEIGPDKVYLISAGGGSISDGVKFIAAASYYEGDTWDMVLQYSPILKKVIPISVILTLPATGSESNSGAVISYRKIGRKQGFLSDKCYPEVAVLDPDTMLSLPLKQIQNGVIDAFVHVCEQYVTDCQDADCQDRYSEGLLITLVKNGEKIMKDKKDYIARSNIMWAANQALNTLIQQGVKQDWATHMIGHELTANLGLDHGQTLAIIQPRLYELKLNEKKDKLSMMGNIVFNIREGTIEERAKKTIVAIENFYNNIMGVKTKISQLDCNQDKGWIDIVCNRFKESNTKIGENNNITHVEIRDIINRSY